MGGDGDDRGAGQTLFCFRGADPAGGLGPVHTGHGDIHQDQIGPQPGPAFHRFRPVLREMQVERLVPQHLAQNQAVGRVVLCGEHDGAGLCGPVRRRLGQHHRGRRGRGFTANAVERAEKVGPWRRPLEHGGKVAPRRIAVRVVAGGGEHQDRHGVTAITDRLRQVQSVHFGHVVIGDHEVEAFADPFQRLGPRGTTERLRPQHLHLLLEDRDIDRLIVDQQDPARPACQIRRFDVGQVVQRAWQRDLEAEG